MQDVLGRAQGSSVMLAFRARPGPQSAQNLNMNWLRIWFQLLHHSRVTFSVQELPDFAKVVPDSLRMGPGGYAADPPVPSLGTFSQNPARVSVSVGPIVVIMQYLQSYLKVS